MKLRTPTEHDECVLLASYLKAKQLKHTHIANETGYSSNKNWGLINRRTHEGVSAGFPDYVVVIPKSKRNKGESVLVFLEMKRVKGSKTSPEQKEWIEALNQVMNVQGYIAKGFYEARDIIEKILIT